MGDFASVNMSVGVDIDFDPAPHIIALDLGLLSNKIRSFREPLEESVKQVMIPSIAQNFDVEGRPGWAPLAAYTIKKKGHDRKLYETGDLAKRAVLFKNWRINGGYLSETAEAEMTGVDNVEYAGFHQSGTQFMPARPFANVQAEDVVAVERVFEQWLLTRFAAAGFFV